MVVIERARAQEAQNVHSSTTTDVEDRERETSDCGRRVQRKDSLRNQMSATGQLQARLEKKVDLHVSVEGKAAVSKTRIATTGILRAAFTLKKTMRIRR